jgi:hypothetical protein
MATGVVREVDTIFFSVQNQSPQAFPIGCLVCVEKKWGAVILCTALTCHVEGHVVTQKG